MTGEAVNSNLRRAVASGSSNHVRVVIVLYRHKVSRLRD